MRHWTSVAVIVAAVIEGGGCAPLSTVDRNVRFDDTSRDSIVVFGFSSEFKVWLYPGVDDGVNWHCERRNARAFRPEQGFIVAKLPARTGKKKYAIGKFKVEWDLEEFGPTANVPVWVFSAPPGQVTYLGALRVAWSDGRPAIVEDKTVVQKTADDYMTRTFPNIPIHALSGRMEWIYMSMDNADGCLDWQGARKQ